MLINESLIESEGDYEKFLLLLQKRKAEGKKWHYLLKCVSSKIKLGLGFLIKV